MRLLRLLLVVHLGNLDGILLDGVDNERPEAARHEVDRVVCPLPCLSAALKRNINISCFFENLRKLLVSFS